MRLADTFDLASPTLLLSACLKMVKPRTLRRNARYWRRRAPDGLSIPPPRLIVKVAGTADIQWFLESGRMAFIDILSMLQKNRINVSTLRSVLDFVADAVG